MDGNQYCKAWPETTPECANVGNGAGGIAVKAHQISPGVLAVVVIP
jgi:hypothetical protein